MHLAGGEPRKKWQPELLCHYLKGFGGDREKAGRKPNPGQGAGQGHHTRVLECIFIANRSVQ